MNQSNAFLNAPLCLRIRNKIKMKFKGEAEENFFKHRTILL